MTKLQLTEIDNFISNTKDSIIIFGDTTSVLTRSVFSLLKDLDVEIGILDTETFLEAYSLYRIRFTPYVHVYRNSTLVGTFTLPFTKEDIQKCWT